MFVRGISSEKRSRRQAPSYCARARGPRQLVSVGPVSGPGGDWPPRFLSPAILGKVFTIFGIISGAFVKDSVLSDW
jgi:hypothetical protein